MSDRLFPALLLTGVGLAGPAACAGDKEPSGAEGLVREDLGSFITDTGYAADVPFEAPTDAYSALIACGPYGYDLLATAETITDPSGSVIYSLEDEQGTAMRVLTQDDMLPMLIPVSPDLDLAAGIYGVRVYVASDAPGATISCEAVYRVQEPTSAQAVDVHFVFVGVDGEVEGLNGTAAVDNVLLNETLTGVGALWADAGLAIGNITYEDFGGDVETYNSVDGATEFGNLLRTANSDERKLTIFMVSAITDSDGATILGQAAGPPGLPSIGGTSKSGAIVTVSYLAEGDTDTQARIIAHEGAHFMGLFHLTEKDGLGHDPISDTPECTSDNDGNGVYSTDECTGQGADHLMWWAASAASTSISADSAWVLQRSALPQ